MNRTRNGIALLLLLTIGLAGCEGSAWGENDATGGAAGDDDEDYDDGGADLDGDADSDGDTDSDPPEEEEEVDYRAETLYAVGYAQHNAGELDEAALTYAQALEQRPDYVELLNQYALLRSQQRRNFEAIDLWTRATQLEPGNLTVRLNLGRMYASLEQHTEALEQYEAATGIDSSNADAWIGGGFALLGIGRLEEGVARLERGLQRDPRYASRMPMVIDALRGRGEFDLADRLEAAFTRAGGRG